MFDYAQVQLLGRATSDAHLSNIDDQDRTSKATFSIACNIPIRRGSEILTRTIFRRIMVLGSYANYVASCQDSGGLKGRLINIVGCMDDERYEDDDSREVTRVAPGAGFIKIMDRRNQSNA